MRSIEIDVRLDGGRVRVKRATGVTDRRTANDMKAMIKLLWRQPQHRHFVLELVHSEHDLADLYGAYLNDKLKDLSPSMESEPLEPMVDEWLAVLQASDGHRDRIRWAFRGLLKGVRRKVLVAELPTVLRAYRDRCLIAKTPRA